MMRFLAILAAVMLLPTTCLADEAGLTFGGDQYLAGESVAMRSAVAHDAFMVGREVDLAAAVSGTAHLAGFNVDVAAPVAGNLYAGGFNVAVSAPVTGSVNAVGNNVSLKSGASIGGNARLAGATVTLAGPVAGSALISAQTLTLDAAVTQDLSFYGEKLIFAPGAKVSGNVLIQAPNPIEVPASVAPADHVKFQQISNPDYVSQAGRAAGTMVGSYWPALWAAAVGWLLLLVVGIAFIALAPRTVGAQEAASASRPFRNFGFGILTLAALLGLVPVAAMTLVGIVLLPFIFILIAVAWGLAYLSGIYLVGQRIARAFMPVDSNAKRVAVFAASLIVVGLLSTIPMLGWLIGFVLMLFGLGTMTAARLDRRSGGAAIGAGVAPAPAI